jgi:mevalonate kinase
MPAFTATAPGKIILFGEHAVVYGQPAIAAPVSQVQARAIVKAEPVRQPGKVYIQAPDIQLEAFLEELPGDHPLAFALRLLFSELGITRPPALSVRITSTIPVAAGLGSGAAVSVALFRALSAFLGHPFTDDVVCRLAYEVEKLHHGTPSGIDNTVISYGRPVFFQRGLGTAGSGNKIELLEVPRSITILIADTGIPSPTAITVGDVRRAWEAEPERYEGLFNEIGQIVREAREAIEDGRPEEIGPLMEKNHALLRQIGVSSPALDRLVQAAREAGALGAKLSGGGRGGNMISLVRPQDAQEIREALAKVGAVRTILNAIGSN